MTNKHTDQELIDLILKLEDELQAKGLVPKYRAFGLPICAMQKLGYKNFLVLDPGSNPLLERIHNLHKPFYRDKDILSGGSHGGAFMFRGIAAMIHAPIWYGKKEINPWELNDLTPFQKKWLQSNNEDHQAYLATCCDIFDFSLLFNQIEGCNSPPADSVKFLELAAFQLQGASTTLCQAFDVRGSTQSALLGAELALKGALRGRNFTEEQLRGRCYGHNLINLVEKVGDEYEGFDKDRVLEHCQDLPQLVENRYTGNQPSRVEAGKYVMFCQFIAGEVARILTNWRLQDHLNLPGPSPS